MNIGGVSVNTLPYRLSFQGTRPAGTSPCNGSARGAGRTALSCGIMNSAADGMKSSTAIKSIRENPMILSFATTPSLNSALFTCEFAHAEHGHEHRDDDRADNETHDNDDDGFNQRGQAFDRGVDF